MNEEWKGDFLGFKFGDYHSDEFNIVRTSDGDRFDETLQPEINDITVEVPGMDGNYFFGSTYGNKTFSISFAFDNLTELQFRKMRSWLGRRQMGELIFDERPYKRYMAKIESPIELSYVCFDQPKREIVGTAVGDERYGVRVAERIPVTETIIDEDTQEEIEIETGEYTIVHERIYPYEKKDGTERIYKGDGTIEFICYFPFAKSVFKQLPESERDSDWAVSSGILSREEYQNYDVYNDGIINIYNAGDLSTGFRLYCPFDGDQSDTPYINRFKVTETIDGEDSNIITVSKNIVDGEITVRDTEGISLPIQNIIEVDDSTEIDLVNSSDLIDKNYLHDNDELEIVFNCYEHKSIGEQGEEEIQVITLPNDMKEGSMAIFQCAGLIIPEHGYAFSFYVGVDKEEVDTFFEVIITYDASNNTISFMTYQEEPTGPTRYNVGYTGVGEELYETIIYNSDTMGNVLTIPYTDIVDAIVINYDAHNYNVITYNEQNITLDLEAALGHELQVTYYIEEIESDNIILTYRLNNTIIAQLVLEMPEQLGDDAGFLIDTNSGLIVGVQESTMKVLTYNEITGEIQEKTTTEAIHIDYNGNAFYTTSGNLYNSYIKSGYLFKLEPNTLLDEATITISNGKPTMKIFYDYLYF